MEAILARGYAVATLDAADFCPDDKERFREGVLSHFFPGKSGPPGPEDPGAIATWAWGLSAGRSITSRPIRPSTAAAWR